MKPTLAILTVLVLQPILACADEDFVAIKSAVQFQKFLGDKTLRHGHAYVTITKDGKLDGRMLAGKFWGTWKFQNGLFCRSLQDLDLYPPHNCETVAVSGSKAKLTSNRGLGTARIFDIE